MADERRRRAQSSPRTAAIWAAVHDLADQRQHELGRVLHVLDLGGGTGGLAVSLAEAGHRVTVIDRSPDALASLQRRAAETGVRDQVSGVQGDVETVVEAVGDTRIDLITCHGTLEFVDDPASALAGMARVLLPGGYLSLVTAQRLAVVLARALAGQYAQAERALLSDDGRWGDADPWPRRFDAHRLHEMVEQAGLVVEESQGMRLFADLVPSALLDTEEDRQALRELERAASTHPDYPALGDLGAVVHVVGRRRA